MFALRPQPIAENGTRLTVHGMLKGSEVSDVATGTNNMTFLNFSSGFVASDDVGIATLCSGFDHILFTGVSQILGFFFRSYFFLIIWHMLSRHVVAIVRPRFQRELWCGDFSIPFPTQPIFQSI